ncbi:MAG: AraC family transcriptional regulator [Spirochaetota bacterium]
MEDTHRSRYWAFDLEEDFPLQLLAYETDKVQDILHWHDYLEIGLCTGGSGTFRFSHTSYPVGAGDVFLINNYEQHVAVTEQRRSPVSFIFIIFLPDIITPPGSSLFASEYLAPFWHESKHFRHRLEADHPIAQRIAEEITEMRTHWDERPLAYRHLCESSLRKVLALMLSFYGFKQDTAHTKQLQRRMRLQHALSYIQEHSCEQISLGDAACQINMSSSHFRHCFKQTMFISFSEYVGLLRISKARDLLIKTDMTVKDIVAQVGYTNEYYFYSLFKKHMHMTPSEYRTRYKRD